MQANVFVRGVTAAGVAALAAGCVTQPFSYLQGDRVRKAELNTYDVVVVSVDGESYLNRPDQPVRVEPGLRRIVVQAPPVAGFTVAEQRTLTLEVKPCVRYFLEAKRANSLTQDFEPRVNHQEEIAGCPAGKD